MNTTLKQIQRKLENAGYSMDVDTGTKGNAVLYYDTIGKNYSSRKDEVSTDVMCELTWENDVMQTCCGVNELGDFNLEYYDSSTKHAAKINLFIQYVFLTLKYLTPRYVGKKQPKVNKGERRGLIFVSNGRNGWNLVEKALLGLKSEFILASTTISPSTKNLLKLYVAKF